MKTFTVEQPLESSTRPGDSATVPFRVILHQNRHKPGEWVTHVQDMKNGSYFWGHYFPGDYDGALQDYYKRCAKYGMDPMPTPFQQN